MYRVGSGIVLVPVTVMIHSVISFLSFLSFYFFSMNVALAEVKEKKHLASASIMWAESIKFHTQLCQCASVLTYNISCYSRTGPVLERLPVMTLFMVVLCRAQMGTRMKPAD